MLSRLRPRPQWLSHGTRLAFSRNTRHSYAIRSEPPSFPTTSKCPSPTCSCSETPELPPNLPIDHQTKLNGTMSPYTEQILICTGKDDWPSKIEDENEGENLAADFKQLLSRGGAYADPYHNLSVINSSFPSSRTNGESTSSSLYLLPSFKYVPFVRGSSDINQLVKGYLQPDKLHPAHEALSPQIRDRLTRDKKELESLEGGLHDINNILVLICGHGGRDARCGKYGPVLRDEFEKGLERNDFRVSKDAVNVSFRVNDGPDTQLDPIENDHNRLPIARVGLISHIGGHKFAGNTIIYLPPKMKTQTGGSHPLAGCGIWYGRVEPKHVDGILKETILGGKVIEELFRGGIRQDKEIMRL